MKAVIRILAVGSCLWVACQSAMAATPPIDLPEPGSIWLAGIAIGALVYFTTRKKK